MAFGSVWQNWIDIFGQERLKYNFDDPVVDSQTGHFTQLVWKSTSRMGCGWARCDNLGQYVVVCSYETPGNWAGRTHENVGHQIQGNPEDQYQG